jgi:hypothetical protein
MPAMPSGPQGVGEEEEEGIGRLQANGGSFISTSIWQH